MKSANEEFCKQEFDAFLQRTVSVSKSLWRDVERANEPPDYYLSLDGTWYAVEVTTITGQLQVGSRSLPQVEVVAALRGFARAIESQAKRDGFLRGMYIVSFGRPIDDFRLLRERIRDSLLGYIKSTQGLSSAPEEVVFRRGRQFCSIRKHRSAPDSVGVGGPWLGRWEAVLADEICDLLAERLRDKAHKLRKVEEPKILLLRDRYHFADRADYWACMAGFPFLGCFHTLFVARSSAESFVLHSQEPAWRQTMGR